LPSPDSIDEQSARSVVESDRTEKSKLAHVGGNPQRSDVAHRIYGIVPVSFDLSVRFRTALVPTPLRKVEAGHLIQISVLDSKGPTTVSGMRGRAIGAQVTLIPSPVSDVEKQKGEFSGFSIEGGAGSDGEFHGLRFNAKPEDLAAIAAGFDDATGCSNDLEMPAPAKS
jgi:hypothetical protein